VKLLHAREVKETNYNMVKHQEIIDRITSMLFKPGELQFKVDSSLSILIRRSIAQYCGYRYWNPSIFNIILRNIVSLFLIPFYIIYLYIKNIKLIRRDIITSSQIDNILICQPTSNIFTVPFNKIYPKNSRIIDGPLQKIRSKDIMFLVAIIRRYVKILFYPELMLRTIRRIAQYSANIEKYNCKIIVVMSAEGSPWSSVLTAYCRSRDVKHVQIMHGIRFYSSQMAFAEFDDYYVWGEYHINVFKKMNVNAHRFIVVGNPIHQDIYQEIERIKDNKISKVILICFDYPIMIEDDMFSLAKELVMKVEETHWDIVFRPHPRYIKESLEFLEKLQYYCSTKITTDNPLTITLRDSIKKADVVVSSYSNALMDAWIAGRKCIYIHNDRIPLQEFHYSKNIKIFHKGDDVNSFLLSPIISDTTEHDLKKRYSYNYNLASMPRCYEYLDCNDI